jgi:hypothetical protein
MQFKDEYDWENECVERKGGTSNLGSEGRVMYSP